MFEVREKQINAPFSSFPYLALLIFGSDDSLL
jgi:hypothetical protein